jgi:tRNA pseudouridine38-40 synthase
MIGFLGAHYQGFQRNPGANTLEDAIERALYAAGGIMPSNYGDLKKIAWTRSARTDKGVSAAACCVGMRLVMVRDDAAEMVKRINLHMPPEIKVHSITPVTGGFDAKAQCSKRRYEYLLPTYALRRRGEQHTDSNSKLEPTHLSQQLQRLRAVLAKFEGTHNFHNYTTSHVKATDAQAKRYILSFEASEPFALGGLELVRCTVLGQSFIMHQVSCA